MTAIITIGGSDFVVYDSLTNTNKYWSTMIGPYADAWENNSAKREKAIINATRLLDRQLWVGTPVVDPLIDVNLQWPRSGVVRANGIIVEEDEIPYEVITAMYEIAAGLILDPSLFTTSTSGKNIKRVSSGGGVEVEFFMDTLGETGRFPTQIQELIGQFLGSGLSSLEISGSFASGTSKNQDSAFGNCPNNGNYGITRGN